MSIYSIKDLENLSGIKAHTIRIWEQRHNLFSPERTDTNIRFYNDDDLKMLLKISILKNHGIKISKIVQMQHEEIIGLVTQLVSSEHLNQDQINSLTVAMLEVNEDLFNSVLAINQKKIGLERTVTEIIYPFFKKIGILWLANSINPAQEHFISNLVRQKLIIETEKLESSSSESFILFLPEGELHEIGLLFANCLLRARGYKTIYLGQSVPLVDVQQIVDIVDPTYLFTVATSKPNKSQIKKFLNDLGQKFEGLKVFITGNQVVNEEFDLHENIHVIQDFEEIDAFLEVVIDS